MDMWYKISLILNMCIMLLLLHSKFSQSVILILYNIGLKYFRPQKNGNWKYCIHKLSLLESNSIHLNVGLACWQPNFHDCKKCDKIYVVVHPHTGVLDVPWRTLDVVPMGNSILQKKDMWRPWGTLSHKWVGLCCLSIYFSLSWEKTKKNRTKSWGLLHNP